MCLAHFEIRPSVDVVGADAVDLQPPTRERQQKLGDLLIGYADASSGAGERAERVLYRESLCRCELHPSHTQSSRSRRRLGMWVLSTKDALLFSSLSLPRGIARAKSSGCAARARGKQRQPGGRWLQPFCLRFDGPGPRARAVRPQNSNAARAPPRNRELGRLPMSPARDGARSRA